MEVSIDPAVNNSGSGRFEIDDEQMNQVQALLTDHGFNIAPDSYQHTVLTMAFVTDEENMENIERIVEKLKDWYTAEDVNYNAEARPQQEHTSDIFTSVVSVYVEDGE